MGLKPPPSNIGDKFDWSEHASTEQLTYSHFLEYLLAIPCVMMCLHSTDGMKMRGVKAANGSPKQRDPKSKVVSDLAWLTHCSLLP